MSQPPPTVAAALAAATRRLSSRLEAELLLAHALAWPRARLYTRGEQALPAAAHASFTALLERRADGEPVAYLLGEFEFWSRPFRVGPAVLVPRPETEHLVERALALDLPDDAHVLDLGTGSGCIAVTLGMERPGWRITATDASSQALAVAADNARRLGARNIGFIQGHWYQPLDGRLFDLVVSNPPYVAPGDPHLDGDGLKHEPAAALVSADGGLADLEAIIAGAPDHLKPGGWLLVEHGHDQGGAVMDRLCRAGFEQRHAINDLAGIARIAGGMLPAASRRSRL